MNTKEIRRSAEGRIGGWNKTVCDLCDEVDEQQKVIDAQYKDIDRLTEALEKVLVLDGIEHNHREEDVSEVIQAALNPKETV